ncbi:MAG: SusC/RagA family TonB-linked outer membrane protein [Cytophagales bacterium]|nr:SusC/RagA family TonB-linked outer membrane protein [Cytophagales bacterium]MDW8383516.1 SusC/RagA family TonB-linked outer membrane protein [Flammeovirgaceae bacterium]
MKIQRIFYIWVALLISIAARAQDKIITGVVMEAGFPLPGANVVIKGVNPPIGTVTDFDGKFTLKIPANIPNPEIIISMVGYKDVVLVVGNQTNFTINMATDVKQLEEVLIQADSYTEPVSVKENKTFAAPIKGEEIAKAPVPNITSGLQGRATGLDVTEVGGMPGAPTRIQVRGVSSVSAGTDPLIIVDGIPITSSTASTESNNAVGGSLPGNPLSFINPNDIETITVLKDASAVAMYGSRGANGVILVTTKSGQKGKAITKVDFNTGISQAYNMVEYVDARQWLAMADQAVRNSPVAGDADNAIFRPEDYNFQLSAAAAGTTTRAISRQLIDRYQINTDWQKLAVQTGNFRDFNISTSKGYDAGSFYLSGQYRTDKGIFPGSSQERYTTRANFTFNVSKKIKASANTSFSYTKTGRPRIAGGGFGSAITTALPIYPIYFDIIDSTFVYSNQSGRYLNPLEDYHVVARTNPDLYSNINHEYRTVSSGNIEYTPFEKADYGLKKVLGGFSIGGKAGIDFMKSVNSVWQSGLISANQDNRNFAPYNIASENSRIVNNQYSLLNVRWNYKIKQSIQGKEILDISLFGARETNTSTFYRINYNTAQANAYTPDPGILTPEIIAVGNAQEYPATRLEPTGRGQVATGYFPDVYFLSWIGRGDFKVLGGRYLLGTSIRMDGSSNFGVENRFGIFRAFSFAWNMVDEPFLKSWEESGKLSGLKFKFSYGETGNASIPSNTRNTTYNTPGGSGGLFLNELGNPTIGWERQRSLDVGMEFAFFDNRIQASAGYYQANTDDMLYAVNPPPSLGIAGIPTYWENIGDMKRWGWEYTLNTVNIKTTSFEWRTDFNFTTNDTRVISVSDQITGNKYLGVISGYNNAAPGDRLGTFYIAKYAGLNESGQEMIYEIDLERFRNTGETVLTGNVIRATPLTVIEHRVRMKDKTGLPRWWGGITNNFSYKSKKVGTFDLSVFFNFRGGHYIFDETQMRTSYFNAGQNPIRADAVNTWTPDNPNASFPLLVFENPQNRRDYDNLPTTGAFSARTHDKFLHRGDYLTLKTIQLGWTLPSTWCSKIKLKTLRIYSSVQNIYWWTRFPGYSPEVVTIGGSDTSGRQQRNLGQGVVTPTNALPQAISANVGVSVSF